MELPVDQQEDSDNVKMHDEEIKGEVKESGEAVVIVEKEISVDEQERKA